MGDKETITLVDRRDTYNFVVGAPIAMTFGADGVFRPMTRWERIKSRLRGLWRRMTWWRQMRTQVSAVDHENACITVEALRWSWRKWKWVRNG